MSGQNEGSQRPRSRTVLSFGSGRSSGSGSYGHARVPSYTKEELVESPKEKAAKRISTKANPNVAINEVEPVAQALMAPTMDSNLRGMQHRDMYGNVITDPDRSNPTRSRMERPLDTIRSFEAAIDGRYGRVGQYSETPGPSRPASSYFGMNDSRRKSSYGINGAGSAYGNGRSGRPESYIDSTMYGSANRRSPAPFGGPPQHRRGFGPRNNSDPMMYGNGVYSQPKRQEQYQPSNESAGSSGGSGGTDNWQPSTDPSSPNSSVDRFQQPPPPPKHDLGEQYGFTGFGETPQTGLDYAQQQAQQQQQGYQTQQGYPNQQSQYQSQNPHNPYQREQAASGPPPPPPHKGYPQRMSSSQNAPLSKTPSYGQPQQAQQSNGGEKRKSWLMRRFSKN